MGLQTTSNLRVDGNGRALDFDSFGLEPLTKSMTFDGGTTNDPGDFNGTGNPATLYTVTGVVGIRLIAYCTTLLAGVNATVEVGTAAGTAKLLALTTATDIDANELWHDATPDSSTELITVAPEFIIVDGADILQEVKTANITSGVLEYLLFWRPLSSGSTVVTA